MTDRNISYNLPPSAAELLNRIEDLIRMAEQQLQRILSHGNEGSSINVARVAQIHTPRTIEVGTQGTANNTATLASASIMRPKVIPITTVVSRLRKCNEYKDETDTKTKPDAYISIQCQILKWLDRHPADMLTVKNAATWTSAIDPSRQAFNPELALSLCYYMRSLGFDTYCRLIPKEDSFRLYIANPYSDERNGDFCYWEQNYKTWDTRDVGTFNSGRRNAVPSFDMDARRLGALTRAAGHRAYSWSNVGVGINGRNGSEQDELLAPLGIDVAQAGADTATLGTSIGRLNFLERQDPNIDHPIHYARHRIDAVAATTQLVLERLQRLLEGLPLTQTSFTLQK